MPGLTARPSAHAEPKRLGLRFPNLRFGVCGRDLDVTPHARGLGTAHRAALERGAGSSGTLGAGTGHVLDARALAATAVELIEAAFGVPQAPTQDGESGAAAGLT